MFDRIVSTAGILGGKPCVNGTRISVEFILELVASGASRADVLKSYPQLADVDVEQALRYAAEVLKNDVVLTGEAPFLKLRDFGLLADENIHPAVVDYLRSLSFDVVAVAESQMTGARDVDVLAFATAQQRIVLTHDADFGTLAIAEKQPFLGIVYLRPGHIDAAFTIGTLQIILAKDPELQPPFVIVGRRAQNRVHIRVRRVR